MAPKLTIGGEIEERFRLFEQSKNNALTNEQKESLKAQVFEGLDDGQSKALLPILQDMLNEKKKSNADNFYGPGPGTLLKAFMTFVMTLLTAALAAVPIVGIIAVVQGLGGIAGLASLIVASPIVAAVFIFTLPTVISASILYGGYRLIRWCIKTVDEKYQARKSVAGLGEEDSPLQLRDSFSSATSKKQQEPPAAPSYTPPTTFPTSKRKGDSPTQSHSHQRGSSRFIP